MPAPSPTPVILQPCPTAVSAATACRPMLLVGSSTAVHQDLTANANCRVLPHHPLLYMHPIQHQLSRGLWAGQYLCSCLHTRPPLWCYKPDKSQHQHNLNHAGYHFHFHSTRSSVHCVRWCGLHWFWRQQYCDSKCCIWGLIQLCCHQDVA